MMKSGIKMHTSIYKTYLRFKRKMPFIRTSAIGVALQNEKETSDISSSLIYYVNSKSPNRMLHCYLNRKSQC